MPSTPAAGSPPGARRRRRGASPSRRHHRAHRQRGRRMSRIVTLTAAGRDRRHLPRRVAWPATFTRADSYTREVSGKGVNVSAALAAGGRRHRRGRGARRGGRRAFAPLRVDRPLLGSSRCPARHGREHVDHRRGSAPRPRSTPHPAAVDAGVGCHGRGPARGALDPRRRVARDLGEPARARRTGGDRRPRGRARSPASSAPGSPSTRAVRRSMRSWPSGRHRPAHPERRRTRRGRGAARSRPSATSWRGARGRRPGRADGAREHGRRRLLA